MNRTVAVLNGYKYGKPEATIVSNENGLYEVQCTSIGECDEVFKTKVFNDLNLAYNFALMKTGLGGSN